MNKTFSNNVCVKSKLNKFMHYILSKNIYRHIYENQLVNDKIRYNYIITIAISFQVEHIPYAQYTIIIIFSNTPADYIIIIIVRLIYVT